MREEIEIADHGDERGAQKSQGTACWYRSANKVDKETAQAMGVYAPSPGGHGVLDPRQTNRAGKEYGEETLWDDGGNAGKSVNIPLYKMIGQLDKAKRNKA